MRALTVIVAVPVAAILILFAMANRAWVAVSVDPFGSSGAYAFQMPLFLIIFLAVMAGILIGGAADWLRQGRHRREARRNRAEMQRLELESARLRAQIDAATAGRAVALPRAEA